jgi:hypothetical protein
MKRDGQDEKFRRMEGLNLAACLSFLRRAPDRRPTAPSFLASPGRDGFLFPENIACIFEQSLKKTIRSSQNDKMLLVFLGSAFFHLSLSEFIIQFLDFHFSV